ncbi:hypothetical protein [Cellulosimicrobium sp. NPDC057862]|uniref:hypothetical protein n=1 Tax=Cellulosimicrobium sp. NPDC057862 TaxID=3346266 RepID=UPI0036734DBA
MTLPPDQPTNGLSGPPDTSRARGRRPLVLALCLVLALVAGAALVGYLILRPRLERQANIEAVSAAFEDCDLDASGASLDRANGSIDFDAVETGLGPTWADVECVGDALGMPAQHLARLREPADGFDHEELRWDVYMVLRLTGDGDTHVSLYHDWWAEPYGD